MTRKAVLFTGQGAQSVGMGRDFVEASPRAAEVFRRAGEILGWDVAGVCFQGPAERLEQTDIQQPAIFTTSAAIWEAVRGDRRLDPGVVAMAGLSLGEYTALYAAGSLSFQDALRLVQRRGQLMQAAAEANPGGMVSVMGLDVEQVETVCRQASERGPIQPANFNCPGQVVVSGARAACEAITALVEAAGGRAVPLKVAGAFHSPLMAPAAEGLARMLESVPLEPPAVPVIANVNCQPHRDPDTIRRWLAEQLTSPVRWQASMERLLAEGVHEFIEIGPGRILSGLMKKIDRKVPVVSIGAAETLARPIGLTA